MIDYRSDTVTRPTPGMLLSMQEAKVGDDVFGEDPSINELEAEAAKIFGYDSAIFCPSGTMTNQIAIKCHTQPGDEIICDKLSHVYIYEGGGIAFNSLCQVKAIEGDRGRITADQVKTAINPKDVHRAISRVVSLENTANRGGGSCYDFNTFAEIREVCTKNSLKLHLDGARLFNAIIAKKEDAREYGRVFDSISICLSKGLGAPVGSLLLGDKDFITKARRVRKVFGGAMRQGGYLAACGLYALRHHVERLAEDHAHAQQIVEALKNLDFVGAILPAETNIVIFEVTGKHTAQSLTERLKEEDIHVFAISESQIRMVTHLDITPAMVKSTVEVLKDL